jgi:phospholipid/cholesterol/gamma-HCH transport system substrate-binding protein
MSPETRVGLFVGAAVLVLFGFIFIVGDLAVLFRKPGFSVSATFDSVAGLDKRAAVKMAGVPVGYVRGFRLEGRRARVELTIYAGHEIPRDSTATMSQLGLLGEKTVEIVPGESPEFCREGDTLRSAEGVGFDRIGPLLSSLGDELKEAARALGGALDEETRAGVKRTLTGAAEAAEELRDFLGANGDDFGRAARDASRTFEAVEKAAARAAADLERTLAVLRDTVEENREGLRSNLEKIREVAGRVEKSIELLNASLDRIQRGEGTVGRLVQDPALYDEAKEAIQGIRATSGRLSAIRLRLDIQGGYYGRSDLIRSSVAAGLDVTRRGSVEAALVRDPRDEAFAFSLLGGYRFGNVAPRVGFIESEFGVGVDYYGRDDAWRLSLEGFDWNRAESPRFRLAARVSPLRGLYLTAGLDDFSLARRREVFFGLGIVLR